MKTLIYISVILLMATGSYAQDTKAASEASKQLTVSIGGRWKAIGDEEIRISQEELLAAQGLVPSDKSYTIVDFKMSAAGHDFQYTEVNGTGPKFNDGMIALINRLRPGCKVYFEYIKCAWKDGSTRMVSPLKVAIK